jgi:hypothetical protein
MDNKTDSPRRFWKWKAGFMSERWCDHSLPVDVSSELPANPLNRLRL